MALKDLTVCIMFNGDPVAEGTAVGEKLFANIEMIDEAVKQNKFSLDEAYGYIAAVIKGKRGKGFSIGHLLDTLTWVACRGGVMPLERSKRIECMIAEGGYQLVHRVTEGEDEWTFGLDVIREVDAARVVSSTETLH
jgi:hypothetical protein